MVLLRAGNRNRLRLSSSQLYCKLDACYYFTWASAAASVASR